PSVDGRPMNLAAALRTSNPMALRSRLHALAGPGESPPTIRARAEARSILAEQRFRGSTVPRPFHGVLVWLGERFRPVRHAVHWLGRRIPGGDWTIWALLAGAVVALCAFAAGRTASRRGAALFGEGERLRPGAVADPAAPRRPA